MPEWDLADRMRKALRETDLGVADMAEYLGVSRNTVGTWINGRITPSVQTLRLWALRTGVPYEWLTSGTLSRGGSETGPSARSSTDRASDYGSEVNPCRAFRPRLPDPTFRQIWAGIEVAA